MLAAIPGGHELGLGYRTFEANIVTQVLSPAQARLEAFATCDSRVDGLASVDFFTAPTATFRILHGFIAPCHGRRRVAHFNGTDRPTEQWAAQQIVEAFPYDSAPRYLIRDSDSIYGEGFRRRVKNMGIKEVITATRPPWQNPFVERTIGSIRRERLGHVIILNEEQLWRILEPYFTCYHNARTRLSLDRNAPNPCEVEPRARGKVVTSVHKTTGRTWMSARWPLPLVA